MGFVHGRTGTRSGSCRAAWLFLVASLLCGTTGFVINELAGKPSRLSKHAVLAIGGSVTVLLIIAVVLLLFAVSRFNRARHAAERNRAEASARQLAADNLTRARRLAERLLAGEVPAVEQVWDVVLQPDERVILHGSVGYSRYYGFGASPSYTPVSTRHYGGVGVGKRLLDDAVDRAANRQRTQNAAFAAAPRWRAQQQSRVVVTDRRLLCQVQPKGWLSFDHREATAIQALPDRHAVVIEYPGTPPLCLSEPVTSQILVVLVWALYGAQGLREHPALAELRSLIPFPDVAAPAGSQQLKAEPPAFAPALTDATVGQPPVNGAPAADALRVDLLQFVAARELVLAEHAARLLAVSESDAVEQLQKLVEQDLVSRVRFSVHSPVAYRITQSGANQIDTALPPPRPLDLAGYRHALAVWEL